MTPATWLLANLGAEEGEGGDPAPGPEGPVGAAAIAWALLFPAEARHLSGALATPRPPWLADEAAVWPWLDGGGGFAWLATASARSRLQELGAAWRGPAPAVVRCVHDKGWAREVARRAGLDPVCLRPLLTTWSADELTSPDARERIVATLAAWPWWHGESFTLKPRWGGSGRGRVAGRRGDPERPTPAALGRLARRGGAVLEPWLDRLHDASAHVVVRDDGRVDYLGSATQVVSPAGVPLGSRGVAPRSARPAAGSPDDAALARVARLVAAQAAQAGYRGPLGVDAFWFRGPGGTPTLHAVAEVNARFTLGLVALGLLCRARRAGLLREARAWALLLRPAAALARCDGVRIVSLRNGDQGPSLVLASGQDELARSLATSPGGS